MRILRAVALASVGWYLMCAPYRNECFPGVETFWSFLGKVPDCAKNKLPDLEAPLSQWMQLGSAHDRASECEATNSDPLSPCRCIASDDPRLAK
jgi:hypothetical protein